MRRGGTVSISGVYGGQLDPLPMMQLFDKGVQIRMGQAHVRRWTDEILPLLEGDEDPLGVDDLTTHQLPLAEAPERLRDVPEEGRRRDQGRPEALTQRRASQPVKTLLINCTLKASPPLGLVQRDRGADQGLERVLIDLVTLMEIDRSPGVALEARVEEARRVRPAMRPWRR